MGTEVVVEPVSVVQHSAAEYPGMTTPVSQMPLAGAWGRGHGQGYVLECCVLSSSPDVL